MSSGPVRIHRTDTLEEAAIIVNWLAEQGIEATVYDPANPGVMAFGVTDAEGIEIYAADAETAQRAKTLLAEHEKERAKASAGRPKGARIEIKCENCGQTSSFEPELAGTIQECPDCGTYVDVPPGGTR